MIYLPTMTEDEIHYVCTVIPQSNAVKYFKQYPKDFAKVMPGFRPEKLDKEQISEALFRGRSKRFISYFIEKHINRWMGQIAEAIQGQIKKGASREVALIRTLPHCYFVDNIGLYFKLAGVEYSKEYISLISESIRTIKNTEKELGLVNSQLETNVKKITVLESQLKCALEDQVRMRKKLSDRANEIKHLKWTEDSFDKSKAEVALYEQTILHLEERLDETSDQIKILKQANANFEKSTEIIASLEREISHLNKKAQERESYVLQLKADLASAENEQQDLERKIKEEIAKQQEIEQDIQEVARPRRPDNIDEFKEFLGYNLEDIGVPTCADYFPLLAGHMCDILFQGKPILISRSAGFSLMKCVSNTLVGTPTVPTLAYGTEIEEKSINSFLSQDSRVLCLDNFIGNYNETILVPICERHKDKIIFLTITYEHTLAYVLDEVLRYCHYLNLNHIEAFAGETELTEDPSSMEESDAPIQTMAQANRWSTLLREILEECCIQGVFPVHKSARATDETILNSMLAFEILPYCTEVLKIAPFTLSDRLVKYAGPSGKCAYKELFKRWFS